MIPTKKIFWIDTETTGLSEKKHGLVQVAIVYEEQGMIKDKKVFNMNPDDVEFAPKALEINGLTEEVIRSFPHFDQVQKDIKCFLNKYIDPYDKNDKAYFGAYNADFDKKFMEALWKKCNDNYFYSYFIPGVTIDPYKVLGIFESMGLKFYPDRKLFNVAESLNIPVDESKLHDAMYDIELTIQVYNVIKKCITIPNKGSIYIN